MFLTDEVLGVMDTNWEEAKAKILAEAAAGTFGQKSAGLKAAAEGDRRRADIKDVIQQLSNIIDPKCVHWTIRVAAAIGRARPSGQIGEFLGEELVDALWGKSEIAATAETKAA